MPEKHRKVRGGDEANKKTPRKRKMPDIRIEFLKDVRCFKKGEVIELIADFKPIILVGDQGTGKSTLLQIIGGEGHFYREKVKVTNAVAKDFTVNHDYELGNVRGGAGFGMGGIDDMATEVYMLQASHGQAAGLATRALFDKLASKLKKTPGKTGMLLLDEPDGGLSIKTAKKLGSALSKVASLGHVVVASLHNPIAMTTASVMVYDVELRKMVKPSEYIDRMLEDEK